MMRSFLMCDENRFLNRKCKSVFIRIELTDFLLDILGDGFIPAMDGTEQAAFRKKRERLRSEKENIRQEKNSDFYKDYRNHNKIYENIDKLDNNLNKMHRSISDIAENLVLLRGPYYGQKPHQQKFCYVASADIFRGKKPHECKDEEKYFFYSETHWNVYELITTLLHNIETTAWKFETELLDTNKTIFFYIKESLKSMGQYTQEPLNLDIKEYFTAFQDVLKNRNPDESFFKYPFNAFSDYLQKNTDFKLEYFYDLWEIKEEAINDLRYRPIKRRNWKRFCPILYDPDYLLHEIKEKSEIVNLFDIEVEFTCLEKLEFRIVNETESTKKNFALKQQYRLFQARLFMAYLLNNIYAAMEKRGITAEQLKEAFAM